LRENNPDDFKHYSCMDREKKPHITKNYTVMKKSTPAEYSLYLIFHRHVKSKVKLSRYKPWRHMGGEEV
jgi:hypothetical protein